MRAIVLSILILLSACSTASTETSVTTDIPERLAPSGEIAFTRGGEVWLAPADTGVAHTVATDLYYQLDRPLTWLPDGSQLVIWDHTAGWVQWAVDPVTHERTALTPPGDHRSPAFTSDGRWMAWMNGIHGLSIRELPGGAIRVLTSAGHRDVAPSWSPDRRRLAWVVLEPVEGTDGERVRHVIHVIDVESAVTRELVQGDVPAWSPSSSKIAFAAAELMLIDADTGALTTLTSNTQGAGPPAWSPSGDRIACIVKSATGMELRIFAADGSGSRKIATVDHSVFGNVPTWSPDGAWLAWMDGPRDEEAILIASSDGATSSARRFAEGGALFPVWRPR